MADLFTNFSLHYGLQINVAKSRACFSTGVPQRKRDKITSVSGIRETTSLGKYLGFPMTHGRVKRGDYNFIIEKIQTRLAPWKLKLLNKTGRLTLAKSVLTSIPIYYMQVEWLPSSI